MSLRFTADEMFEVADRIEKNGVRFYRRLAEVCSQPEQRDVLLKLASMEEEHQRIFAIMRSELSPQERQTIVFDPERSGDAFLRAMADGAVFDRQADPAAAVSGRETPAELLKIAMGMEKDSIVFYLGMKEHVPARLGGARLEEILREEMAHIGIIAREFKAVAR